VTTTSTKERHCAVRPRTATGGSWSAARSTSASCADAYASGGYYAGGALLKAKNLRAHDGVDFPAWALRHLDLRRWCAALDVGCGWGRFALPLAKQYAVQLTCVDVSPGMLSTCRETLAGEDAFARYIVGDACHLPFTSGSFDAVVANHMLYLLEDVDVAVREFARVLRSDGQLLATTYSDVGRVPLLEFHAHALRSLGLTLQLEPVSTFALENGRELLERAFHEVDVDVLEDVREIDDAQSVVDVYVKTGHYHDVITDACVASDLRAQVASAFRAEVERELETQGVVRSTTAWTAFTAREPRRSA